MKIKILPSLAMLLITAQGSYAATIQSRPLKLSSEYEEDMNSKIDAQTKEIQQLLGRIELLEHSLAQLKERIDIIDGPAAPVATKQVTASVPVQHAEDNIAEDDIFNEPISKKPIPPAVVVPQIGGEKAAGIAKSQNADESKEKKLYDAALAALKDSRLEIAEEKFSSFIKDYPKSQLQSNAYFWYGETFFKRNMYDKAAINYLKGYKQYPKGSKAADSLLKLALSLGELKKKTESCTMLEKLDAEFPNRPASSIKRAKDAKVKFGCK